jgi:dihydrofolate synthase/folylpolyglutamate synthase
VLLAQAASVGATVAREGIEFGVVAREIAVGGQQLVLKGLRGTYGDIYLPLFGAYQAGNAACALAAVEAFAGVSGSVAMDDGSSELTLGPGLSSAMLDPALVRDGLAKVSSPGRLEVLRRSPTVLADASHNPAGMEATLEALTESFVLSRVIGVVSVMEDKDVASLLAELEPVLSDVVVTSNSSPRSMPAESLAVIARDVFGEDRVLVRDRLDDAIEAAVGLADESVGDELPGSSAVLITGSVVTAGDARLLLAPGVPADPPPPPPGMPARHSFTAGDLS